MEKEDLYHDFDDINTSLTRLTFPYLKKWRRMIFILDNINTSLARLIFPYLKKNGEDDLYPRRYQYIYNSF